MEDSEKNVSLVNVNQSKVVKKVYNDILKNPGKKIGTALATILDVGNTVLWPVKWANDRSRLFFENNIERYKKKLDKEDSDEIVEVPSEISIPILERFNYVSNEEIRSAFINLLVNASLISDSSKAHPGFIRLIDRMSPDEAVLLKYIKPKIGIPVLTIKHHYDPEERTNFRTVLRNQVSKDVESIGLIFPKNIKMYLDNLQSLGIIKLQDFIYVQLQSEIDAIFDENHDLISEVFAEYNQLEMIEKMNREERMYEVTEFGYSFIEACFE